VSSPVRRATVGAVVTAFLSQGALTASGILSARLLGPSDRGYAALLTLVPSTIAQVGAFGLPLAITYFLARRPRQARALLAIVARPVLAQLTVLLLAHAAITILIVAGKPDRFALAAILSLGLIPATFLFEYAVVILQGTARYTRLNVIRVLPNVGYALALLGLLTTSTGELTTVIASTVAVTATVGACGLLLATRSLMPHRPADDLPTRREVIRFGIRSYFGYVAPVESFRLDQLYIGSVLPPASLGLYVVGAAFSNLPRFIGQAVGTIAVPHVASLDGLSAQVRATWRFFGLAVAVCAIVAVTLVLTLPALIPFLFGPAFEDATGPGQVLVAGGFLLAIRRVLTEGARSCGLPGVGSVAELAALIAFVPTVVFLGPEAGERGVAWAYTGSAAFGFLVLIARFHVLTRSSLAVRGG
jgi:O-antigen/teichoic acid export membrane protein